MNLWVVLTSNDTSLDSLHMSFSEPLADLVLPKRELTKAGSHNGDHVRLGLSAHKLTHGLEQ
jgi:hypothetical protein